MKTQLGNVAVAKNSVGCIATYADLISRWNESERVLIPGSRKAPLNGVCGGAREKQAATGCTANAKYARGRIGELPAVVAGSRLYVQ